MIRNESRNQIQKPQKSSLSKPQQTDLPVRIYDWSKMTVGIIKQTATNQNMVIPSNSLLHPNSFPAFGAVEIHLHSPTPFGNLLKNTLVWVFLWRMSLLTSWPKKKRSTMGQPRCLRNSWRLVEKWTHRKKPNSSTLFMDGKLHLIGFCWPFHSGKAGRSFSVAFNYITTVDI